MKKILETSAPTFGNSSETIFQLVEQDGEHFIEKIYTRTTLEQEIETKTDPKEAFREFLALKAQTREQNKKRIDNDDAFYRHYILGQSWREIADEVGQKSTGSIAERGQKVLAGLASQYMSGASLSELADQFNASENQMHTLLTEWLEAEREKLLRDYEAGEVMNHFDREAASINSITMFLGDQERFRYQLISPFDADARLQPGKLALYSEAFYEFTFSSGRTTRVSEDSLDALSVGGWNHAKLEELLNVQSGDKITLVTDMFGQLCERTMRELTS